MRGSREESAVADGPVITSELKRGSCGNHAPPTRITASSRLHDMRADERTCPRPRRSHERACRRPRRGRLNAKRVDPSNGSSSRRTSGSWNAARTTDMRRLMPCEKPAVMRSDELVRSKRSRRERARVSQPAGSRRSRAAKARCSQGVALGMRPPTSGQYPVRCLAAEGSRARSTPAISAVPDVGGSTPASTRSVVDLPAPFAPHERNAAGGYGQVEAVDSGHGAERDRQASHIHHGWHPAPPPVRPPDRQSAARRRVAGCRSWHPVPRATGRPDRRDICVYGVAGLNHLP